MEPDPLEIVAGVAVIVLTLGLPLLAGLWIHRAFRLNELRQRQILAMIEKGIAPPPELNPLALERLPGGRPPSRQKERFKSGGIMLVGLGAALALVIGVAGGQARVGIGVGAAVAALGAAMLASALVSRAGDDELPPAPGAIEPLPTEPLRPGTGEDAIRRS